MIFKKKEIVAASLVVLIGMAGYLNWSYQDTIKVKDTESYIETGKMLGEAELVSANNEVTEDTEQVEEEPAENVDSKMGEMKESAYFEDAKLNRESARAAAMEMLKETSADEQIDEATRTLAGEKLVKCAENIELESCIESVAAAKGFEEVCAYINEGAATITVRSEGMTDDEVAKLKDVVTGSSDISADKIRIVEVK